MIALCARSQKQWLIDYHVKHFISSVAELYVEQHLKLLETDAAAVASRNTVDGLRQSLLSRSVLFYIFTTEFMCETKVHWRLSPELRAQMIWRTRVVYHHYARSVQHALRKQWRSHGSKLQPLMKALNLLQKEPLEEAVIVDAISS